ncbi:hypothetical protein L9F63_012372, partial [Diploptera punctata]
VVLVISTTPNYYITSFSSVSHQVLVISTTPNYYITFFCQSSVSHQYHHPNYYITFFCQSSSSV